MSPPNRYIRIKPTKPYGAAGDDTFNDEKSLFLVGAQCLRPYYKYTLTKLVAPTHSEDPTGWRSPSRNCTSGTLPKTQGRVPEVKNYSCKLLHPPHAPTLPAMSL